MCVNSRRTTRRGGGVRALTASAAVVAVLVAASSLSSPPGASAFVTSGNRMKLETSRRTFRPSTSRRGSGSSTGLSMYLSPDDTQRPSPKGGGSGSGAEHQQIRRLDVRGVSVSKAGFLLLLSAQHQNGDDDTDGDGAAASSSAVRTVAIPVRVTSPSAGDAYAATSAEALTLIQLLSGVDMAGAVLPPQALQDLVATYCTYQDEDDDEDGGIIVIEDELGLASGGIIDDQEAASIAAQQDAISIVKSVVSETLPEDVPYDEANEWLKVRVKHPKMTLDGVRVGLARENVDPKKSQDESDDEGGDDWDSIRPTPLVYKLQVTVEDAFRLEIPLYSEIGSDIASYPDDVRRSASAVQGCSFDYHPDTSAAFTALSLSLRYRIPVVVEASAVALLAGRQLLSDASGTGETHCVLSSSSSSQGVDCDIANTLPQWRGTAALRDASDRVVRTIERGFEANKLQAALKIAREKGDAGAEERIKAELAKFDDDVNKEEEGRREDDGGFGDGGPCTI